MVNTDCNKNQVFISFRGKDERFRFLDHLKRKLIESNVNVFTDDNATGQPIKDLFVHIRNSKIAIVIFSQNFSESRWCMDEIVEIKKCIETKVLKAVIPIFFEDDVTDVKKQSGNFGEKFIVLQNSLLAKEGIPRNEINSRIEEWKEALSVVTEMIGLSYQRDKYFGVDFVEKVVKKVTNILDTIVAEEKRNSTPGSSETPHRQQSNPIFQEEEMEQSNPIVQEEEMEQSEPIFQEEEIEQSNPIVEEEKMEEGAGIAFMKRFIFVAYMAPRMITRR